MISVLVCSKKPEFCKAFKENVSVTIGVPYEVIFFDNRQKDWGLSKVYNFLAARAKFDILCFSHEDVEFVSNNWGKTIIEQIQTPNCGIIGFAGSKAKSKTYSGWGGGNHRNRRFNFSQVDVSGKEIIFKKSYDEEPLSKVLVLDGFCFFVKKTVWAANLFDENTFQRFHLYDLDFSLQVSLKYQNYVNQDIKIRHFSAGSYSSEWKIETEKFHSKWNYILPIYLNKPNKYKIATDEVKAMKDYVRLLENNDKDIKQYLRYMGKHYWWNYYALNVLLKYFITKKI